MQRLPVIDDDPEDGDRKPAQAGDPRARRGRRPLRRKVKAQAVGGELLEGQSREVLKALHLLTPQGDLNADALRKLKQVNHFLALLTPAIEDVQSRFGDPVLVDAGSGSGYLGFLLYERFFQGRSGGRLLSIESRPELVGRARQRSSQLGFHRMEFIEGSIEAAILPPRVNLMVALHACDTATDDAIAKAVANNADHLAVVPCCQAEVARQLKERGSSAAAWCRPLFAHPWHRRELGSHLTNVVRALALEAVGYSVTVTELTGWEHSLKNELILARKVRKEDPRARVKLQKLLSDFAIAPKLIRSLKLGA